MRFFCPSSPSGSKLNSRSFLFLSALLLSTGRTASPSPPGRVTLPGGTVLLTVSRPQARMFRAVALTRAGTASDPAGKQGLAVLAASLIPEGGTRALSPRETGQALEMLHATADSQAETDINWIALSCPAENLRPAIRLFADLVMNPSFEVAATREAKKRLQARDRALLADPGAVMEEELRDRLLGNREERDAGWIDSGAPESLSSITREDLLRFHRAAFDPSRTILAVSGDFSAADVGSEVRNALAGWTAQTGPELSTGRPPFRPGTASVILSEIGQGRFSFVLGRLGFKPDDPHAAAEGVLFALAGGRPFAQAIARRSGINADELKGALSLSRDAEGRFLYRLTFEGDEKHRESIVTSIQAELDRLKRRKPPRDELRPARRVFLASALPEEADTTQALVTTASLELYGIPTDYGATLQKEVEKVSGEDITKSAAHCLESF
jgi:zinc protease